MAGVTLDTVATVPGVVVPVTVGSKVGVRVGPCGVTVGIGVPALVAVGVAASWPATVAVGVATSWPAAGVGEAWKNHCYSEQEREYQGANDAHGILLTRSWNEARL